MAPMRNTKRKPTGALKRFADAGKYDSRIIGDIERFLLNQAVAPDPGTTGWDKSLLHASEMSNSRWCPRQSFYRLTKAPGLTEEAAHFQLEAIWEAGNEIHRKWQGWINALGRLRGQWRCIYCNHHWAATSPQNCPDCGCPSPAYDEVPIWSEEYGISAHADGDIDEGTDDDPLLEIKSIGIGTLRHESPSLLAKYTHTVTTDSGAERKLIDLDRLWRDIKRPLPSHLKQGMLYCFLTGRSTCIFIYEFKPTQAVKEFVIRFRKSMIEDLLDLALDVKFAVEEGRPPVRPSWAAPGETTCAKCVFRDTCWGTTASSELENDETEDQHQRPARRAVARRQGPIGERGTVPTGAAEVRDPRRAHSDNGDGRRGSDEPVREAHSLAGLLERAVRPGGSGRAVRRRPPDEAGG